MKILSPVLFLSLFLPLAANTLPIEVNPATPLTGTFSVEWDSDGNFESWTTSEITGATVSGGTLSGTTNGTDPQVRRTNFTGPDLDLGFNDYLEIRIQVPANFADNIEIHYGTTATTGFSGARILTIPNATIPKDGAFHTYRIDVGPEPWWRASLRDLRVDPGNTSGVPFAIDYLRVGDLPGDVYLPNTIDQPVTAYELSSKHFRFIWNATRASQGVNTTTARAALRNAEEAWQVYVKILGYREPAESMNLPSRDGNKYKINFLCTFDGYWMGGSPTGFGYFNIEPSGLQANPPTWIIPHELMHVFQMHNTSGHVPGEWWETHANYGRERWLQHYQNLYPNRSNIEALAVRDGHFMMSSGRNFYLTWPFMYYVDTNPDNLPDLYDGIVAQVWQETQQDEFPMMTLDRITPTTSLKDLSGYYARRTATWDFSNKAAVTAELNTQDPTRNARHLFTDLIQRADAPDWWRVPPNKAPAQGAYAMHELIPAGSGDGRVVTVNLQGLADSARGADWRASLIAVSDSGVERYTPLWSNGSSSITLAANENKLYLSVAGTPDVYHYGSHDEAAQRFRSHPSRSRFHYQVQVTGATPRERNNGSSAGLVQHANGGGWKANTANVHASAYLGPNARVLGNGFVASGARVEDYAVVQDSARIENSAIVSGHAWVRGSATVRNFARVRDWAIVDGGTISDNARVLEHATVAGNMSGTAVAKGSALHQGGTLSGNAIVDGDYMGNKSISGGITFGHLPFVGIPDNFTTATPAGLYAAYDFRTAHDSRALDQHGVTDAFTVGSPAWTVKDGVRRGFLTFNGSNQYLALDRSVADTRAFSFSAWVKPSGGPENQALLWLGSTTTRRLSLTVSPGSGQTKFSIVNGGAEQTLTTSALPVGTWSHIAVTLNGTTGVLYVNGTAAASGSITIRPDELLAANTTTGLQHNYLARSKGTAAPMFQGSLDDAQFYSIALSAAQITTLATPPAAVSDLMLSDNFNSESFESATFNNTLAADQQGYYAPTTYSIAGGGGWQAQHGNGGTMLLVGDNGYHARASLNRDFALVANEFDQPLAFQMDAWVDTGNNNSWASVVIGSSQHLNANSSSAKFAIRPMQNGSLQVWVNGSQMPLASRSGNTFRFVLSDTDGTGSAFNGNGSKAALYSGATLIGTYTLPQLSPDDGYLTFGAQPDNGYTITRVDNLSISLYKPPPTSLTWQGGTSTDFNTASNYLENFWAEWIDCVFDSNTVNGSINVDETKGWGNLTLKSGLATDITIGGPSIIHMAPGKVNEWIAPSLGGTITLAADGKDLSISNRMLVVGGLTWNIGAGRTLNLTGTLEDWPGVGTTSLEKQGAGTAVLTGNNPYSGATTITGGTLQIGTGTTIGTLGSGPVTIHSGANLTLNRSDNLTITQNFSGAGSITKNGTGNLIVNTNIATITAVVVHNGLIRTDNFRQWNSDLDLTVNAAGVFEMWNTTTSLAMLSGNGTVKNSANWSGYAPGQPYATNNLTIAAGNFSGTITDNGFGDGSTTGTTGDTRINLFKSSNNTLTLSGTTSYTGNTTVNAGTLRLGNGTSPTNLSDSANVIVAPGAMLHLDYSGTDTINALWVDGLQMPPGVYSSSSGFITGPGTLTVATGPASANYATWAGRGIHDLSGGPSDDDDNDGIPNLLEYVLGGNPRSASSGILPTATASSGDLVITFRRIHATTADTTQVFQYATDLSGWTDVPLVAGGIVAIQPNTPQAGTDTVTISVPKGTEPRIFGRLKVSNPTAQP